jgi:ATP-dependent DNA helicase RecQ
MALSCVYRCHQASGFGFGAGHLIDILRGKPTEKVIQHRHEKLSTFAIGSDVSDAQWRGVFRQLVALGHLRVEGEYHTLALAESARTVLRGQARVLLRRAAESSRAPGTRQTRSARRAEAPSLPLEGAALGRFAALKAWRAEVARAHNLPAYIVFHDATLAEMARSQPDSLAALAGISGVGAKKLEAYGREILRVLGEAS